MLNGKRNCVFEGRVRVSCVHVTRSMVQIHVAGLYPLLVCKLSYYPIFDSLKYQLAAAKLLRGLILTNRDQLSNELAVRGWIPLLANWLVCPIPPFLKI